MKILIAIGIVAVVITGIFLTRKDVSLIHVTVPKPNTVVTSPLVIRGEARGNWYFEASFPIELVDGNGVELARGIAQAQGDPATGEVNWMTTEFVPFQATLNFTNPQTTTGIIILKKDNPSGLPEHDAEIRVPVHF